MKGPTPKYVLEPCTLQDVSAMSEIYIAAFKDNYFKTIWAPKSTVSKASMMAWLEARFSKLFFKREDVLTKAVESSTGEIVAWVRWTYPFTLTEEEHQTRKHAEAVEERLRLEGKIGPKYPEGAIGDAFEAFFGQLEGMRDRYVVESTTYVCHLLAVNPEHQRRGLGRLLLEPALAKADSESAPSYIESTEEGYGLYKKLGWKDVDVVNVDLSKWGAERKGWFGIMVREPNS